MYKPRLFGALNLAIARERKEVYYEIYWNGDDGERFIATGVDPNAKTIWSDTEKTAGKCIEYCFYYNNSVD